jgi:hypothetical protein
MRDSENEEVQCSVWVQRGDLVLQIAPTPPEQADLLSVQICTEEDNGGESVMRVENLQIYLKKATLKRKKSSPRWEKIKIRAATHSKETC